MTRSTQLLGAVSAFALIAMSSAPAMAEGIAAGTVVTNTVEVDYQVGGVVQDTIEATNTFTIDRRVSVDVEYVGATGVDAGTPFEVAPGQTTAAFAFDVTNFSNAAIDLDLNAALPVNTNSRASITQVFVDNDNDGTFSAGDTVDFASDMAADETRRVIVVVSVANTALDAETFQVDLNANAFEVNTMTAGGTGTEIEESASDTTGIDTALVDGDTGFSFDADRDGSDTDRAFAEVSAANVSVIKSSVVISDPVNNTTNPKAIPGAVIRYCIAVSNSGGGAPATNIAISDALPGEVDFNTGTIRRNTDVSIAAGVATCDITTGTTATDDVVDADGGQFDSGVVSGSLNNVGIDETLGFTFDVTIIPAVDDRTDSSTTVSETDDNDTPD